MRSKAGALGQVHGFTKDRTHLFLELRETQAIVQYDPIGQFSPCLGARLGSDDAQGLLRRELASGLNSLDLRVLAALDDQDAVKPLLPPFGLGQKGDVKHYQLCATICGLLSFV